MSFKTPKLIISCTSTNTTIMATGSGDARVILSKNLKLNDFFSPLSIFTYIKSAYTDLVKP
jgi:hypothetical protein